MSQTTAYPYTSARSTSFTVAIIGALLVETAVLHLWLRVEHPALAWTLTVLSVATVLYVVADYRAMGRGAVHVDEGRLLIDVAGRARIDVPMAAVARATRPRWQDLPEPGSTEARGYRNLMKPASPNVLVEFREPVAVRLPGGLRRPVERVGLCLDDPDGFVARLPLAR